MTKKKIDVIIPTYKPGKEFLKLIDSLEHQDAEIGKIIIINTEEKYFQSLVFGHQFEQEHATIEVFHISRMEFDHAATRRMAIEKSDAEFFVCMTQDAMPVDETLISKLTAPLIQGKAQASYARQLPREDANEIEKYTRSFNYPDESAYKTKADLETLGIKTYFFSNVCAAYQRSVYDEIGGLPKFAIFNEDMYYAANLIKNGYTICYAADATVIHSHSYTAKEQFHRNFDIGVSHAERPDIFEGIPTENEGKKLVKNTVAHLKESGKTILIPKLIIHSAYKYLGYKKGLKYHKLSERRIMKYTLNKEYWLKKNIRNAAKTIDSSRGYGMSSDERAGTIKTYKWDQNSEKENNNERGRKDS